MSIRYKLLSLFFVLSSIPLLIVGTLNFTHTKEALEKSTVDSMDAMAEFKQGEVFLYLNGMQSRTQDFASDGFIRDSLEQIQNESNSSQIITDLNRHLLLNKQPLDQQILAIDVVGNDGKVIASSYPAQIGADRSQERYFTFNKQDIYIKDAFQRSDGTVLIEVFAPLTSRTKQDKVIGAIINQFDASALNELLAGEWVVGLGAKSQIRSLGKTGETYLVNQDSLMITDSLFITNAAFNITADTYPVRKCLEDNEQAKGTWLDYRKVPVVGASTCIQVGDFKWTLISEQDETDAFIPVKETAFYLMVIMALTFSFVALIALFITRVILKPISTLSNSTKIIAAGNLDHRVRLDSNDEIGKLSQAFDEMIDHLKQSRSELELSNDALHKKIQELDEFTYIASHDLQEPTRKIISFSDLLVMDLPDDLPEKAKKDLYFITDAAKRMQTLIQDLLVFSRTGRSEMDIKWLLLDDIVDQAISNLNIQIKESGALITRDELPEVLADQTLLTLLYQNLISNAIKFCKDQPEIRITAEIIGGVQVFGVKDNGIGIDSKFNQQIFLPFKRLHGHSEYRGTGVGLAICTKAIERHAGTLWVESEPNQGAHFKFVLNTEKIESD